MDTVCVIMMAKSICMVDEMMKMDASMLSYPMILVSSGMVCFVGCIMVPPRLATNLTFSISRGVKEKWGLVSAVKFTPYATTGVGVYLAKPFILFVLVKVLSDVGTASMW